MAGKDVDIIDEAMKSDDFDYGDKTPVVTEGDDSGSGNEQLEQSDKTTGTDVVEQPTQRDVTQPNARVPNTGAVQTGLKRVGPQFADAKGNIVDKDGKILARSGEGARLWQEASRAIAQVNNLTRQLDAANRKIATQDAIVTQANEIANLPQKFGISREDFNEGITLMSKWRANPLEVCKDIIARTMTFGYNATDILGKSAGDALEMRGVQQMIREATAPLLADRNARTQSEQQNTQVQQAYQAFVDQYEYADVHSEAIANLMNNKGMKPVDAYYTVREFARDNQLDFTQPLGPQVAQRASGQRQTPRMPLPNGSGGGSGVSQGQTTTQPTYASADDTWGDILNSVLKE